jgi:site-specific DNA-methyltransferase (adenine-specific)
MRPYYQDDAVTIYHGDSLEVMQGIEDESIDLLWTDPPYGHSNNDGDLVASMNGLKGSTQKAAIPILNDDMDSMKRVVDGMLVEGVRILKADCCCCCCCCCCGGGGPKPTFAWVANRMDSKGLSFFHSVIWDKAARGIGMGWRFRRDYEMVMVSHRKGGKLAWSEDAEAVSNIVRFYVSNDRQHPNEKPIDLPLHFIRLTTEVGGMVLDPFMGSGTTLRAAKDLGRKAIGIEIEERYCEISAKRMAQEVFNFTSPANHALA